jgi:ribosome-binding factor A
MRGSRRDRVAEEIKEILAMEICNHFPSTDYGLITVTKVWLSKDLKYAKIYYSVYGGADVRKKANSALQGNTRTLRLLLAQSLRVKYVPELNFFYDDTLDYIEHLEELFQKIHGSERPDH